MRCRTADGLSVVGAESAWLTCVSVAPRVMGGAVADARGRGNSGRGGRGLGFAVVTRPAPLITLFRVCCSCHCDYLLALALVLPTRVAAAVAISFMFSGCLSTRVCPRDGIGSCVLANVGTPHRRHRVVRGQGPGFKQPLG